MPHDLPIPDFLQEDEEMIHQRMLGKAPPGISTREGDFFWDATRPAALEKAEMTQLKLQNILRLALPQTSYGQYLDFLGEMKGEFRHPPTRSTGKIEITGELGIWIPAGCVAYTEASGDRPALAFKTTESATIDESGSGLIDAECLEAGAIGNVAAGTIILLGTPIQGVTSITNPDPFAGGTEGEDDDSFRERVLAAYDEPLSGARRDYIAWAKQVPGVGGVYPIPLADGPGTVKVLITDSNGQPASQALIDAVQEHVAPDDRYGGGLAPIGVLVTAGAPEVFTLDITATLVLDDEISLAAIEDDVRESLRAFLAALEINTGDRPLDKITVTRLGYAILDTEGVKDYKKDSLTVNGGDSVDVPVGVVPVLGEVVLT